jgi:hypothetical protein
VAAERFEDWLRACGQRCLDRVNSPFPQLTPTDAIHLADLVAAVREERRLNHRMDAYSGRDLRGDPPTISTIAMEHTAAEEAVEAALSALDEATDG